MTKIQVVHLSFCVVGSKTDALMLSRDAMAAALRAIRKHGGYPIEWRNKWDTYTNEDTSALGINEASSGN